MKQFCKTSLFVVFLLLSSYGLQAQATHVQLKPVCLKNTEQFSLTSKYVAGENYIIQVGLPIGYAPSIKSYPVLYVLDGDKSFGMTKEITDWLIWSKEIKDIIVVGISYGKGTDEWWQKRARDYSHCDDTIVFKGWFNQTGGADNFLKFVKNELFPMVNNKYRINQDSTAIMGFSFGGLLSSYVLFTQPDMFKGYIIISPALVWNNNSILKMEADYFSKHKELNNLVYMSYDSLDSKDLVLIPTKELIQTLQSRNYEGLKFVMQILEGETHISGYPVALTHGLKTVFKR
jgi:predicted alpha/beta superfamily hydrolase